MSVSPSARTPRSLRLPRRVRAVLLAFALAGCATTPSPRPPGLRPPVPGRPAPGYERRVDELQAVDSSVLAGRRIALDPGHGGIFRGALGVNGLTEAEVNLGVAFHLRGLLEARGAVLFMTRTDDRDFLSPADSSLRADLAERTRLANAFQPDLFLSIHHNADARGAHDVNETQTYYKLGDDGPSLDAAESVHRYLVRNLGIARHRVTPGNYFVLRNNEAPALLTESSYITNPDVEHKLALAAKQRLEAEALFLGIARFFARRVPVIEAFRAVSPGASAADSVFVASPSLSGRVRGAFDEVRLTVDGDPVKPRVRGDRIDWSPAAALTAGMHETALTVRLAAEGTSRSRKLRFRVVRACGRVVAEFPDQAPWHGDPPLGLRVRVLDADGQPYRDSVRVRIRDLGTRPLAPADTQIVVTEGEGWVYFRASTRRPATSTGAPQVRVRVGLWPPRAARPGIRSVEDVSAGVAISEGATARTRTGFARCMPGDSVLREAPGTGGFAPALDWINRDGFVRLPRDSSGDVPVPQLAGYRPWPADPAWPPRFTPICGGVLHGRRIVVDPDGGGEDPAGVGISGTRAASLNLEVGRALAGFLRAAGAEVLLTRSGDYALSEVERVEKSEAFHAERFLRIGHRAEPPMLGYYYSSAPGKHWAAGAGESFTLLGLPAPPLAEDAQYPLQQTSCPALYVSPARVDAPASEERLLAPGGLRAEAYALFLALAREWAPDAPWPLDSIEVRDAEGRPVPGATVTLGGALVLETDGSGRARLARTEPGPLEALVDDPRVRARAVLLESERGRILTGTPGR